jgi:hypothetical protein
MNDTLYQEKQKLLAIRETYTQNLLEEVKEIKTDFIQTKNLVVLGGAVLILGYVLLKTISGVFSIFSKKEEKVREIIIEKPYQVYDTKAIEKESFMSPIIKAIKQEIRLFLLGIAKEALRNFLEKIQEKTKTV